MPDQVRHDSIFIILMEKSRETVIFLKERHKLINILRWISIYTEQNHK